MFENNKVKNNNLEHKRSEIKKYFDQKIKLFSKLCL